MKIPLSGRKKALIIVDMQSAFLTERNKYIVPKVAKLIAAQDYDLFVESVFYTLANSLWKKQLNWSCPKTAETKTTSEISSLLAHKKSVLIEKQTKSVFKGDQNLKQVLVDNDIAELHIVGIETNDCVMATALESFDLGFFTYVLEECVESYSTAKMHENGIAILRKINLTNNSVLEKIKLVDSDL